MFLTEVRHDISSLDKTVVVHELELETNVLYNVVNEVSVFNIT